MNKKVITVIGAGLMGHGIAQVFAVAGHTVKVYDNDSNALNSLREKIEKNLLDIGQRPTVAMRVEPVNSLPRAVADSDVIFEAGPENLEWKRNLFHHLEKISPPHALLASNTSVLPIKDVMSMLETSHRAMGTHWWNPPYLIPLVEVIKSPSTDAALAQEMVALLTSVGKSPVLVEKDIPGFIGNRLQHALWREAIALVADGVCDAETVDVVVKSSFGPRLSVLGPLENADLVGIELTQAIHKTVLPALDRLPGPSEYLQKLLNEGKLGMKSGEGFYSWTPKQQESLKMRLLGHLKSIYTKNIG